MEVKSKKLQEEYKILADFCEYKYYPFEKKGQKFTGWYWKDPVSILGANISPKISHHFHICRNTKDLLFKYDFNRIFRVIDKIEEVGINKWGDIKIKIEGNSCSISIPKNAREPYNHTVTGDNRLFVIYEACVRFVKWYNQNA